MDKCIFRITVANPSGSFLHVMCMQLSCMFKETCMSHVTCIESIQNPCMLHAHNMQTCMENVPNPCMLHAKSMPVTCRNLGRISTRATLTYYCYYCTVVRVGALSSNSDNGSLFHVLDIKTFEVSVNMCVQYAVVHVDEQLN